MISIVIGVSVALVLAAPLFWIIFLIDWKRVFHKHHWHNVGKTQRHVKYCTYTREHTAYQCCKCGEMSHSESFYDWI